MHLTFKNILLIFLITPLLCIAQHCASPDTQQLTSLSLGCPEGQTQMQDQNGPYCVTESGKCLNAVMINPTCPGPAAKQVSYQQGDCQTCGHYPLSRCPNVCSAGQKPVLKNNLVQFCVDADNNCLSPIDFKNGYASTQEPYMEDECAMCGMYPTSFCPGTCVDGQTPILKDGLVLYCVDGRKQCLEKMSYHAPPGTQQKKYRDGQCQACGLHPISLCPSGCAAGQKTIMRADKPAFCVDEKKHTCLTLIDYSSGIPTEQKPYQEDDCAICGLYPSKQCPATCLPGQQSVKINGEVAFCTDDTGKCLSPINYSSGVASAQTPYNLLDCATCGLYPVSKCPPGCANGQKTISSSGKVDFCTDANNQCLTPINYTSGSPSMQLPYTANECSECGLYPSTNCPAICESGQTPIKIDGKLTFCTDKHYQCWHPISFATGNASAPTGYKDGDCSVCGLYPVSKCPTSCAVGQEPISTNGELTYCVDNNHKCLTPVDYSMGAASKQKPYALDACATCGQHPISSCPVFCQPGQKPAVQDNKIVFCVNSQYQCLTPVSYNNDGSTNAQKSYTEECCSSGYYGNDDTHGQFTCPPLT